MHILLGPYKLQNHTNDWKEKEKKKEREGRRRRSLLLLLLLEKKAMVALLVFIMATLEKKTVGLPFGGNVTKISLDLPTWWGIVQHGVSCCKSSLLF